MTHRNKILGSLFKDSPSLTLTISLVVGLLLGWWMVQQDWAQQPIRTAEVYNTYVLIATISGIAGAFAGVALTFGLGGGGKGFRIFRANGGSVLAKNWASLVISSFLASALALVSAILFAFLQFHLALIVAVTSLVVLAHLAIRTTWLMGMLVQVVRGDDAIASSEEAQEKYGSFSPKKEPDK